jgi:hypothetical protein
VKDDAGPVPIEVLPHNGAADSYDGELKRWTIFLASGEVAGHRREQAVARAFAETLPGPEALGLDPIIEPHRLAISPRSLRHAEVAGSDAYETKGG